MMAAMGLFDVQGGACERPTFQMGSPLFDKIEIKLSPVNATGKTFVIETTGNTPDAYYVQSATLNGSSIPTTVIPILSKTVFLRPHLFI